MNLTHHIKSINALAAKLERAEVKVEQYQVSIGQHIKAIKAERPDDWEKIVKEECNLGRRSAYDYIAIADGTKTVEGQRVANAAANKRLRDRQRASRDAQTRSRDVTVISAGKTMGEVHQEIENALKVRKRPGRFTPEQQAANAKPVAEALLAVEEVQKHNEKLAKKLRAAKTKIAGLESKVKELKAEKAGLKAEKAGLKAEVEELRASEIGKLRAENDERHKRHVEFVEFTDIQIAELKDENNKLRHALEANGPMSESLRRVPA
jgi:hypothetical protein